MEKIAASNSMGRPAYLHDLRKTISPNVNTDLSKDNVLLVDELQGRTVEEYLDELLQPAINEYNEKQKRADRKINMTYTEWHNQDKRKGDLVYELVMQYGDKDTIGKAYYEATDPKEKERLRNEIEGVYRKWLKDWQEQHPGMKVLWSNIHFDEEHGTPHLHLAVSPIARDFKRGPAVQVSMQKCLENDGFPRSRKAEGYQLMRAFTKFREIQEADLRQLGYDIKEPTRGRHDEPEVFRQVAAAEKRLQIAEEKAQEHEARVAQAIQVVHRAKNLAEGYVQEAQEATQTREQEEKKIAALGEQKEQLSQEIGSYNEKIAEQENAFIELERKVEAKKEEVKQTIAELSSITDEIRDAQKNPIRDPEILSEGKKRRGKEKVATVELYKDEYFEWKQQRQIVPKLGWVADAIDRAVRKIEQLFKIDDIVKPLKERAERAEREARAQQIERAKSDREVNNLRWFLKDKGLLHEYEQSQELTQSISHHHHR